MVALAIFILDAGGGPGWGAASAQAVLAARLDHLATSPLYDLLANAATALPVGEPGFRLGVLAAILGAVALGGVVAGVRALVPREVAAALTVTLLLVAAAPFREAAAFAAPSILAACGAVWAFACAARYARNHDRRNVPCTFAACMFVVGSAPWLGAALTIIATIWLWRAGAARDLLALCVGALGAIVIALWFDAVGGMPMPHPDLGALTASGRGAGAIVVGAGLLGVGFGALTGLRSARWLALIVIVTAAHEALFGGTTPVVLAVFAIGGAIVPSAIVRAAMGSLKGTRRQAMTFAAGVPLIAAALAMGPVIRVDDPGATPTQLASDLTAALPPGPGVFVATRPTTWLAVRYEAAIAGARADFALVPPLPTHEADAVVANAIRGNRIAASDAAAFGRLDIRRAIPRGRGFQLIGEPPATASPVPPPARYATAIGEQEAALLALERARYEATSGRLDAAARALGLTSRFRAADLAVLATTLPTKEHPALFGFLPLDERPPGPWLYDIFGDDLAWVAGLDVPPVDANAPMARRLHAKWRDIIVGKAKPDDPAIVAMGPRAVAATKELFK